MLPKKQTMLSGKLQEKHHQYTFRQSEPLLATGLAVTWNNVFASHLEKVFQLNEMTTDINPAPTEIDGPAIKTFTPKEIKFAIDKLNPRKAPGIDSIPLDKCMSIYPGFNTDI